MVSEEPRHKIITSAHQEAVKRLRKTFPGEYRGILADVYAERGVTVRKRRTKDEILADRLAEARRLLEENS